MGSGSDVVPRPHYRFCTCPECCHHRRVRNRDQDWKKPGGWIAAHFKRNGKRLESDPQPGKDG